MLGLTHVKAQIVISPVAIVDDGSWTTVEIDTAGFSHLTVICNYGFADIAMVVLKLQSATTSGGSFSDVDGCVFGTSNGAYDGVVSTLPSSTDDNNLFIFDVDLRSQNRFFDLIATGGNGATGSFMSAIAILSSAKQLPDSATDRGAAQVLRAT